MTIDDYPRDSAADHAAHTILKNTIHDCLWLFALIGAFGLVGYLCMVVYRLAGPIVLAGGVMASIGVALLVPHLLDRYATKKAPPTEADGAGARGCGPRGTRDPRKGTREI